MKRLILTLTTCVFILGCGAAGAGAQEGDRSPEGRGMMGHGGMMGCGMMGRGGMMGSGGMMGHGAAMRFIFALMDSDGDGTVSLQEFQAAHEKIFKAMDTDKDGTLTHRVNRCRRFMGTLLRSPWTPVSLGAPMHTTVIHTLAATSWGAGDRVRIPDKNCRRPCRSLSHVGGVTRRGQAPLPGAGDR